MFNINLTSKLSVIFSGVLIFFVPFLTYLSPENLRELSRDNVLEIFISLIFLLIIIFISSFSLDILIKRLFKKKTFLFPLLCFAFYLNFLYLPFSELLYILLFTKSSIVTNSIGLIIFIFFELCCLVIIVLGVRFNIFAIRVILIFAILMLIKASFPLAGHLIKNISKTPEISYEITNTSPYKDEVSMKRNVYYIILDAMASIESAEQLNIISKKEVKANLVNTGLKYIDKSQSSYSETQMAITSIMFVDYPQTLSSKIPLNYSSLFPLMISTMNHNEIPLISYVKKANSSFLWSAKQSAICRPSKEWICINSPNIFFSNNLFKFTLTTPLPKIFLAIFRDISSQDSISPFLEYIENNGLPKNQFFAYIHNDIPHNPYRVTSECEPTNYINQNMEGYKSSYNCALKTLQIFMEKINIIDPEAIVVFQGDHGIRDLNIEITEKEKYLLLGRVFNAIKAPETCFKKYGAPKTTVNTLRFVLNCAYGYQLPYRENIHYDSSIRSTEGQVILVERLLYE